MKESGSSAFAPLAIPIFRALWIANVASMVGTWIHEVGAAWLMTSLSPSPLMVALVQAATSAPMFLLAVPAGALADLVDRRRFLIAAEVWMLAAAGALALLVSRGAAGPWTLLAITFALGIGSACHAPAWQATVPQLVPPAQLPAAVALGGVGMNLARAVGPAIGGLIVAAAGPAAAFGLNAVSFLGTIVVLVSWRSERAERTLPAERFVGAMRAGLRYVRHAPAVQAVLVRAAAFIVCGSAIFATLPLLARRELGLSAAGYGTLLGALGVGAVLGATQLPRARRRLGSDKVVAFGSLAIAAALVVLALVRQLPLIYPAMLAIGVSWMFVLSTLNVAAQSCIPAWVRARALSVYILVFFAGLAGGAVLWGAVASRIGLPGALLCAAAGLVAGAPLAGVFRIGGGEQLDLAPSMHWTTDVFEAEVDHDRGPVLVTVEYTIDPANAAAFTAAMRDVHRIRRRDGAFMWGLFVDVEDPRRFTETFVVESWVEHLRQHERVTVADRDVEARARKFHVGAEPPRVRHLIAAT